MEAIPRLQDVSHRPLQKKLVVLTAGFVLAVFAAEVAYRVVRVSNLGPTTNPAYVGYNEDLGWSYRPGARERHQSPEFDVQININSRGFRGAEWPAREEGRKRVLILGDSLAFGWGVSEDATFAARMAELEPTWDVLNAAVSGFGTDQELLLLQVLREELEPDLVICLFCSNDLFECAGAVSYGRYKPYFELEGEGLVLRGSPVPRPIPQRVSQLWRAVVKHRWDLEHVNRSAGPTRGWRTVEALFVAMKDELGDVPLLILSERNQLIDLARRSDLEHLDIRPALLGLGAGARFPVDGHFTEDGHRAIADVAHDRSVDLLNVDN